MSKNKKIRESNSVPANAVSKRRNSTEITDGSSQENSTIQNFTAYLKNLSHWWLIVILLFLSIGILGAGLKYLEESAREEIAKQKQNPLAKQKASLVSRINPYTPPPTPTPQHSKDYIYTGPKLVAVEDHEANAIPPGDLAVWRPSEGYWYCMGGAESQSFTAAWGTSGDTPVQGDYDGDGKTDLAIFRPTTNMWWIYPSGGESYYTISIGSSGGTPAPADYDGDGKTDPAIFNSGTWSIFLSQTQSTQSISFGTSGDVTASADYDNDGRADIAVWRSGSSATFYVLKSSNGQTITQSLGTTGDAPVPGDYDGDAKADFAVRHGNDWVIRQSSDSTTNTITWYLSTDTAVQNDYDGDGKTDIAVWRPSGKGTGNWRIRNSHDASTRTDSWGIAGDTPVPALYRR